MSDAPVIHYKVTKDSPLHVQWIERARRQNGNNPGWQSTTSFADLQKQAACSEFKAAPTSKNESPHNSQTTESKTPLPARPVTKNTPPTSATALQKLTRDSPLTADDVWTIWALASQATNLADRGEHSETDQQLLVAVSSRLAQVKRELELPPVYPATFQLRVSPKKVPPVDIYPQFPNNG